MPPEAAVYPPSALLVVAPFAGLPWPAAGVAFDCVAGLAFAVAVLWMAWRFGRGQPLGVSLMLSAMFLILALGTSVREALVFGNPSLLAIALAAIGILCCTRSAPAKASRVAGALCLGVAVALKPQLTLVAVLFLFTQSRQRRSAVYGFAVFALILGVASAAYALGTGNLHFLTQLGENMRLSLAPGYSSDPSPANPESFGFLNLQVLAWRIPHLGARAGAFAWTITSLLGFALLACLSTAQGRLSRLDRAGDPGVADAAARLPSHL